MNLVGNWNYPTKIRFGNDRIEELADAYVDKGLRVGKVDVDENPNISAQYGIRSIPTVMLFDKGQIVDTIIGVRPKSDYEKSLKRVIA